MKPALEGISKAAGSELTETAQTAQTVSGLNGDETGSDRGKRLGQAEPPARMDALLAVHDVAVPSDVRKFMLDGGAALEARASSMISCTKPARGKQSRRREAARADEARARSAALSRVADTVGVSFSGREFQRQYYASKFALRGELVYSIFRHAFASAGAGDQTALRRVFERELTARGSGRRALRVCSVGGGPGTDAAGVVAANRDFLGFGRAGSAASSPLALAKAEAVASARAAAAAAAAASEQAEARRAAHAKRSRAGRAHGRGRGRGRARGGRARRRVP